MIDLPPQQVIDAIHCMLCGIRVNNAYLHIWLWQVHAALFSATSASLHASCPCAQGTLVVLAAKTSGAGQIRL
jgi:hypothetical protein